MSPPKVGTGLAASDRAWRPEKLSEISPDTSQTSYTEWHSTRDGQRMPAVKQEEQGRYPAPLRNESKRARYSAEVYGGISFTFTGETSNSHFAVLSIQ